MKKSNNNTSPKEITIPITAIGGAASATSFNNNNNTTTTATSSATCYNTVASIAAFDGFVHIFGPLDSQLALLEQLRQDSAHRDLTAMMHDAFKVAAAGSGSISGLVDYHAFCRFLFYTGLCTSRSMRLEPSSLPSENNTSNLDAKPTSATLQRQSSFSNFSQDHRVHLFAQFGNNENSNNNNTNTANGENNGNDNNNNNNRRFSVFSTTSGQNSRRSSIVGGTQNAISNLNNNPSITTPIITAPLGRRIPEGTTLSEVTGRKIFQFLSTTFRTSTSSTPTIRLAGFCLGLLHAGYILLSFTYGEELFASILSHHNQQQQTPLQRQQALFTAMVQVLRALFALRKVDMFVRKFCAISPYPEDLMQNTSFLPIELWRWCPALDAVFVFYCNNKEKVKPYFSTTRERDENEDIEEESDTSSEEDDDDDDDDDDETESDTDQKKINNNNNLMISKNGSREQQQIKKSNKKKKKRVPKRDLLSRGRFLQFSLDLGLGSGFDLVAAERIFDELALVEVERDSKQDRRRIRHEIKRRRREEEERVMAEANNQNISKRGRKLSKKDPTTTSEKIEAIMSNPLMLAAKREKPKRIKYKMLSFVGFTEAIVKISCITQQGQQQQQQQSQQSQQQKTNITNKKDQTTDQSTKSTTTSSLLIATVPDAVERFLLAVIGPLFQLATDGADILAARSLVPCPQAFVDAHSMRPRTLFSGEDGRARHKIKIRQQQNNNTKDGAGGKESMDAEADDDESFDLSGGVLTITGKNLGALGMGAWIYCSASPVPVHHISAQSIEKMVNNNYSATTTISKRSGSTSSRAASALSTRSSSPYLNNNNNNSNNTLETSTAPFEKLNFKLAPGESSDLLWASADISLAAASHEYLEVDITFKAPVFVAVGNTPEQLIFDSQPAHVGTIVLELKTALVPSKLIELAEAHFAVGCTRTSGLNKHQLYEEGWRYLGAKLALSPGRLHRNCLGLSNNGNNNNNNDGNNKTKSSSSSSSSAVPTSGMGLTLDELNSMDRQGILDAVFRSRSTRASTETSGRPFMKFPEFLDTLIRFAISHGCAVDDLGEVIRKQLQLVGGASSSSSGISGGYNGMLDDESNSVRAGGGGGGLKTPQQEDEERRRRMMEGSRRAVLEQQQKLIQQVNNIANRDKNSTMDELERTLTINKNDASASQFLSPTSVVDPNKREAELKATEAVAAAMKTRRKSTGGSGPGTTNSSKNEDGQNNNNNNNNNYNQKMIDVMTSHKAQQTALRQQLYAAKEENEELNEKLEQAQDATATLSKLAEEFFAVSDLAFEQVMRHVPDKSVHRLIQSFRKTVTSATERHHDLLSSVKMKLEERTNASLNGSARSINNNVNGGGKPIYSLDETERIQQQQQQQNENNNISETQQQQQQLLLLQQPQGTATSTTSSEKNNERKALDDKMRSFMASTKPGGKDDGKKVPQQTMASSSIFQNSVSDMVEAMKELAKENKEREMAQQLKDRKEKLGNNNTPALQTSKGNNDVSGNNMNEGTGNNATQQQQQQHQKNQSLVITSPNGTNAIPNDATPLQRTNSGVNAKFMKNAQEAQNLIQTYEQELKSTRDQFSKYQHDATVQYEKLSTEKIKVENEKFELRGKVQQLEEKLRAAQEQVAVLAMKSHEATSEANEVSQKLMTLRQQQQQEKEAGLFGSRYNNSNNNATLTSTGTNNKITSRNNNNINNNNRASTSTPINNSQQQQNSNDHQSSETPLRGATPTSTIDPFGQSDSNSNNNNNQHQRKSSTEPNEEIGNHASTKAKKTKATGKNHSKGKTNNISTKPPKSSTNNNNKNEEISPATTPLPSSSVVAQSNGSPTEISNVTTSSAHQQKRGTSPPSPNDKNIASPTKKQQRPASSENVASISKKMKSNVENALFYLRQSVNSVRGTMKSEAEINESWLQKTIRIGQNVINEVFANNNTTINSSSPTFLTNNSNVASPLVSSPPSLSRALETGGKRSVGLQTDMLNLDHLLEEMMRLQQQVEHYQALEKNEQDRRKLVSRGFNNSKNKNQSSSVLGFEDHFALAGSGNLNNMNNNQTGGQLRSSLTQRKSRPGSGSGRSSSGGSNGGGETGGNRGGTAGGSLHKGFVDLQQPLRNAQMSGDLDDLFIKGGKASSPSSGSPLQNNLRLAASRRSPLQFPSQQAQQQQQQNFLLLSSTSTPLVAPPPLQKQQQKQRGRNQDRIDEIMKRSNVDDMINSKNPKSYDASVVIDANSVGATPQSVLGNYSNDDDASLRPRTSTSATNNIAAASASASSSAHFNTKNALGGKLASSARRPLTNSQTRHKLLSDASRSYAQGDGVASIRNDGNGADASINLSMRTQHEQEHQDNPRRNENDNQAMISSKIRSSRGTLVGTGGSSSSFINTNATAEEQKDLVVGDGSGGDNQHQQGTLAVGTERQRCEKMVQQLEKDKQMQDYAYGLQQTRNFRPTVAAAPILGDKRKQGMLDFANDDGNGHDGNHTKTSKDPPIGGQRIELSVVEQLIAESVRAKTKSGAPPPSMMARGGAVNAGSASGQQPQVFGLETNTDARPQLLQQQGKKVPVPPPSRMSKNEE